MDAYGAVGRASAALAAGLAGVRERTADAGRVARTVVLNPSILEPVVVEFVKGEQRADGGWVDCEDSVWCAALLALADAKSDEATAAVNWIANERSPLGGWGRNPREPARVPTTAIALRFLGDQLADAQDWTGLECTWARDLASDVQLAYKAGFFLSCQAAFEVPTQLSVRTAEYLSQQQNEDGGFGPWCGHPLGSDPWSTGVCLAGLSRFAELADRDVVERAVNWLVGTQLGSGYWRCHFIDEGTSYACWGLSEAVKLMETP